MRSAYIVSALAAFAAASPVEVPLEKRQTFAGINDAQILNYALTLEHLESTFYNQVVAKFSANDFAKAGYGGNFYSNLKEIAFDEMTHVNFLTAGLQAAGATPVAACTYNFNITDVNSVLVLAQLLEGVGVSAYLGAAAYISNKNYLTAAAAILTVEARHSGFWRQNLGESPFPAPFDIPLDFNKVYSLAALFIVSCPASNPALPLKAFPAISVLSPAGQVKVGGSITTKVAMPVAAQDAWFITFSGPVEAAFYGSGDSYAVIVPTGVQSGQEYLVYTSDKNPPTDDNTLAVGVVPIVDNDTGSDYNWEHNHKWNWPKDNKYY